MTFLCAITMVGHSALQSTKFGLQLIWEIHVLHSTCSGSSCMTHCKAIASMCILVLVPGMSYISRMELPIERCLVRYFEWTQFIPKKDTPLPWRCNALLLSQVMICLHLWLAQTVRRTHKASARQHVPGKSIHWTQQEWLCELSVEVSYLSRNSHKASAALWHAIIKHQIVCNVSSTTITWAKKIYKPFCMHRLWCMSECFRLALSFASVLHRYGHWCF